MDTPFFHPQETPERVGFDRSQTLGGRLTHIEDTVNRTNAVEQPVAVAANILGEDRPYAPVPYFWTDQFGTKIQVHGTVPADAEDTVVAGSREDGRFLALYSRDGHPAGVLGWNMPKQARLHRKALVDAPPVPSPVPSRWRASTVRLSRPGPAGHHPRRAPPPGVRRGHPPLRGPAAGQAGAPGDPSRPPRRIPTLRVAGDLERLPFKYDSVIYGVHELPVTW